MTPQCRFPFQQPVQATDSQISQASEWVATNIEKVRKKNITNNF